MPLVNPSRITESPPVKTTNRFSRFVWLLCIGSMLLIGLGFFVYGRYPEWISGIMNATSTSRQVVGRTTIPNAPRLTQKQMDEASVSYENYEGFGNMQELQDNTQRQQEAVLRGFVAMPATKVSRSIYLPIYEGVSPYVLSIGAGVGQPNRQMGGRDNFPIFAHNMGDYMTWRPSFFSPLQTMNQQIIGSSVYTTDGKKVYQWNIKSIDSHLPNTKTEILQNKKDQEPELTMIACQEDEQWWARFRATGNTYAPERIVLKADLAVSQNFKTASVAIKKLFPDLYQNYVTVELNNNKTPISKSNFHRVNWKTHTIFWGSTHVTTILALWCGLLIVLILINCLHTFFWRKRRSQF